MLFEVIFFSLVVMLASLSGLLIIWTSIGSFLTRNLRFLVSFSAGVFLVLAYGLSAETLELAPSLFEGIVWIVLGVVGTWGLFKIVPSFHHHHDKRVEGENEVCLDPRRILFGDAIHNIVDGILLAASFAVSMSLGILTVISVFVHELVQETSEFFVLKESGLSTTRALTVNFLVSATILIGSLGSFFLLRQFEALEVVFLGFAAGSFLLVVFYDLIPHSIRTSQEQKQYSKHALWFMLGIFLMLSVTSLSVPHSHENDHEHHEADHSEYVHDHEIE